MDHSHTQSHNSSFTPTNYNNPPDTWYCSECGTLNMDWVDVCPACGAGTRDASTAQYYAAQHYEASYTTHAGAGSPAPGAWECESCGASNSDNTPDFCPICGASR